MATSHFGRNRRVGIALVGAACALLLQGPGSASGQTGTRIAPARVSAVTHHAATVTWTAPLGSDPKLEVTVFYGIDDAGMSDTGWQNRAEMVGGAADDGQYEVVLKNLEPQKSYVCRIRESGAAGVAWSPTTVFDTPQQESSAYLLVLVVVVLLVVPFYAGGWLAKRWRMPDHGWKIGLVLCTVASSLVVVATRWPPRLGIDLSGGTILIYEVAADQQKMAAEEPPEGDEDADAAGGTGVDMDGLVAAISERVNPGGTKEMTVRPYGADQIEIIIPRVNAEEATRVERIISRAGTLEFRILANSRDHKELIRRALADPSSTVLRDAQGGREAWWVPVQEGQEGDYEGYLLVPESERNLAVREIVRRGQRTLEVLVVQDTHNVNGDYLSDAAVGTDENGNPCVKFQFDTRGARLFGRLTSENLPDKVQDFHRQLGIILDGRLYSAPRILSTISAQGEITMGSPRTQAQRDQQQQEVEDLVRVLNAGSLPTSLKEEPISKMVTGPTLGHDTIVKGCWAIGASSVLVLIFMLVYYRFAGIVACAALMVNLALILAIMITVKAAFTLPGLAGLVLTLGMSVDANILVFERIREELARGAALRMAIRNGFNRATTTIVDANLTTLITGVILFVIGTDQVKGFAITLSLGVLMSMYTAIFCSRVVFEAAERQRWISKLTMMRFLGDTQYDFLGKRRLAYACSLVVIVAGLAGVVYRGKGLLDIDFTGGVSVVAVFDNDEKIADVRDGCPGLNDLAVSQVESEGESEGASFWINTSTTEVDREKVADWIVEAVRQQILKTYGAGSLEQNQAIVALREEALATLAIEAKSGENDVEVAARREAAVVALGRQAAAMFADASDGSQKQASLDVVRREVNRMARIETAIGYVEEYLHQQFLGRLAANEMGIESLGAIGSAVPETPEASPPAPAESAAPTDQGRNDLPGDDVLAMAGPLLAAGEPGGEGAEPAAADADAGNDAATAAPDEPAADETPADGGTEPSAEPVASDEEPAATGDETEQTGEEPTSPIEEATAPQEETVTPVEEAVAPGATPAEPAAIPAEPTATPGPAAAETATVPAGPVEVEAAPAADRFAGGTLARLTFSQEVSHHTLIELLATEFGSRDALPALELTPLVASPTPGGAPVPDTGFSEDDSTAYTMWDAKIKLPAEEARGRLESVKAALAEVPYFPSSSTIGGTVASSTQLQAIEALVASLLCLVAYIWIRFQKVIFGLAAVLALVHDVLVTLGAIALSAFLAPYFGFLLIGEFKIGLSVLAAFLTIIGYSLNDTIVVFDRIREVRGKAPRLTEEMLNASVNQTLSRTVLTAFTTFIVVLILYLFGGEVIHTFAFALVVGVVVGTYSSIYIASPILLWMAGPAKGD